LGAPGEKKKKSENSLRVTGRHSYHRVEKKALARIIKGQKKNSEEKEKKNDACNRSKGFEGTLQRLDGNARGKLAGQIGAQFRLETTEFERINEKLQTPQ